MSRQVVTPWRARVSRSLASAMWTCASMRPGSRVWPVPSIVVVLSDPASWAELVSLSLAGMVGPVDNETAGPAHSLAVEHEHVLDEDLWHLRPGLQRISAQWRGIQR
jgi:hypothetical protein